MESTKLNKNTVSYSIEKELKQRIQGLRQLFSEHFAPNHIEREETWLKFRAYSHNEQLEILKKANLFYEICNSAHRSGDDLRDSPRLLWYAIRKLGNLPPNDLFEKIKSSDVVEIYNSSGIQVFRNHRFFEICSYDFSELFIYPWHELYDRETHVDETLMKYGQEIFSGKCSDTIPVNDIPGHKMQERFSPEKYTMSMQEKWFSPLKRVDGTVEHNVAISEVTVIDKHPSPAPHHNFQPELIN